MRYVQNANTSEISAEILYVGRWSVCDLHRSARRCMTAFAGAWHRKKRSHMDALNEFDPLISRYLDGSIPPDELTAMESRLYPTRNLCWNSRAAVFCTGKLQSC